MSFSHGSSMEMSQKKRVAVLVDNTCESDRRVIQSAEAIAAQGYDVRVFCRDKPNSLGSNKKDDVYYDRLWIPTFQEKNELIDQLRTMIVFLLKMPGDFWSKFVFILTAFVLLVAHIVRKLVRGFKNRKTWAYFSSILFVFIAVPVLVLTGFAAAILLLNRAWQAHQQPDSNIDKMGGLSTDQDDNKKPSRLFDFLYDDISDETYVQRILKHRAARIYVATKNQINAFNPDIVHAHDLATLPAGRFLAQRNNAKLIYDAHELETGRDMPKRQRWKDQIKIFERHFIKSADAVITVSEGIANVLEESYSIAQPTVIYNTPHLVEHSLASTSLRQDIGISDSTKLAVYVGGLKLNRGLPLYLRAIARIPDLHFAACGTRSTREAARALKLAKDLNMTDRFHLIGPVEPASLVEYIKGANLSVMPTQNIGDSYLYALPNKFFESAFANVPIIVGKEITQMAGLVKSFDLGVLVKQDDPNDIYKAIQKMMLPTSKPRNNALPKAFIKKYGWMSQRDKLVHLYDVLSR